MNVSILANDRSFRAKMHFVITDVEDDNEKLVAASYVGVPEAVNAITASILEGRGLYVEANQDEYTRSYHPYHRLERRIGDGDVAHGMVFNSLATQDGIKSLGENEKVTYVIALDGNSDYHLSRHFQVRFGLPKEWLSEYVSLFRDMIVPLPVIKNEELSKVLWNDIKAFRITATQEEVLLMIEEELFFTKSLQDKLRQEGVEVNEQNLKERGATLVIPKSDVVGRFHPDWSMKDYMINNSEVFARKLSQLKPRHDVGDPIHPAVAKMKRIPFPAQANMIQVLVNTLEYENSVGCSGDMGTGKSIVACGVVNVLHGKRQQNGAKRGTAVLLSAPGITLKKWREKEIRSTLPDAKVHMINSSSDAIKLMQKVKNGYQPKGIEFYLVGIDKAKRSPEPYFAGIWRRIKGEKDAYAWHCPDCGNVLTKMVEGEEVPLEWEDVAQGQAPDPLVLEELRSAHLLGSNGLPRGEKVIWQRNRKYTKCEFSNKNEEAHNEDINNEKQKRVCGAKLWRPALRKSGNKQTRLWKRAGEVRNETRFKKFANITRIFRRMNKWFDLYICDEVHQAKATDTGRGDAFAQMVLAAKKNLLLTGTLVNGKSTSIKEILWRTDPKMLLDKGINHKTGDITWAERYGKLKQVINVEEEETGWNTRRKRKPQQPKEEPGISPEMTAQFLLHKFGFMELGDMGLPLVELKEIPVFIDLDPEHEMFYHNFHEKLYDHCKMAAILGAKGAFSKFIPATINYADRPDLGAKVVFGSGEDRTVISAPPLEGLHAKERYLIQLIKDELAENRRCVIFNEYTASYGMNERIKEILEAEGIRCEILDSSVSTDKRTEKLQEFEEKEIPVIICNMQLVEVGLDMLYWPTIIFYQLNYEVSKIRQASRRSWRIGQSREARVYYLVYNGTQQMSQFLRIMSARGHALMTEGRLDKSELAQYSRDGQSSLANDLAHCFATSEAAEAWKKIAAKDLEEIETVAESEFQKVMEQRMKALAHQTLRMCGINPEAVDISVKDQIVSWINATITSKPTKNVFLRRIDELVERIEAGSIKGFTVENGTFKVDYIEAFGFASVSDGQLLMYLLDEEQPEENQSYFKLVEADVSTKGRRKKVPEGQLMFDLFAL